MTDQPTVSRFILRKGAVEGKWMIWDRRIRAPARLQSGLASELSEEDARQLLEQLSSSSDQAG